MEDVERVYRETFILTTLKHPNIIKLFEVLDTPKSIMFVLEYASGGELFSYVSGKGRLGELESCRLFQQIIAGVECQSHTTHSVQCGLAFAELLAAICVGVLIRSCHPSASVLAPSSYPDCHRAKIIHRDLKLEVS